MTMKKYLLGMLALAMAAAPAATFAATYAYVNQQGEVRTVEAATPQAALTTAPNIDEHSGVMLINTTNDPIVGDQVSGV
jgi:hypothetical protein